MKICDDAAPGRIIQKARKFSALSLTVPYDAGLARLSSARLLPSSDLLRFFTDIKTVRYTAPNIESVIAAAIAPKNRTE